MRADILVALSATSAWSAASVDQPTPVPRQDWVALCHATVGRDDAKLCFTMMRRMVIERYPAVMIKWDACRDRNAAERWGWAALMERRDVLMFLEEAKRACVE